MGAPAARRPASERAKRADRNGPAHTSTAPPSLDSHGIDNAGAYLNARQQLLLAIFGIDPGSLPPRTGLHLAKALDALEALARSVAADPDAVPANMAHSMLLELEHTHAGALEHVSYRLSGTDATLSLATVFDGETGELHCVLALEHMSGIRVHGALTHRVALMDGIPVLPASDPVGDYVRSDPGALGELDDFSDLVASGAEGGRDSGSDEGVGSFFAGAIAGDFAGNDSWSAVGGQTAMGFVPIAGQLADIRDIAAAGADVFQGSEGAWARLGISIIAVIPGLDFLKGGTKAGRKAMRQASEGAVTGTAKATLKRLGKVMSREAAARAAKELKRLAVAREEMLARMNRLLVDESLGEATKNRLRRVRNGVQDHLQPSDLSGALRDKHGLPVRRSGSGEAWDHAREVKNVTRAIERAKDQLHRELYRLEPGSDGYGKLSRELDALSEMERCVKAFLEIE